MLTELSVGSSVDAISKSLNSHRTNPSTELLCEVWIWWSKFDVIKKAQLYQRLATFCICDIDIPLSDRVGYVVVWFHFLSYVLLLVHSLGFVSHLSFYLCKHLYKCYPRLSAKVHPVWHLTCPRFQILIHSSVIPQSSVVQLYGGHLQCCMSKNDKYRLWLQGRWRCHLKL